MVGKGKKGNKESIHMKEENKIQKNKRGIGRDKIRLREANEGRKDDKEREMEEG